MAEEAPICVRISKECPIGYTVYGYRPSLWVNTLLASLFTIALFANIWLGIRFRLRAYAIVLSLGCMTQIVGYGARIGMYFLPFNAIPFQAQVCCLIIGPAFNSAAVYLMLKHVVALFGPEWSLLKPKLYTIIFIGADIVSLVLQAAGGGIAATTAIGDDDMLNLGNSIMMAGIAFQVVTLSVFASLATTFCIKRVRAVNSYPLSGKALQTWQGARFRWFVCGLSTAFLTIYIRCVYRIAEMRGGWGNKLMKEQIPFILLEGLFDSSMILIATLAQTVLHPGPLFPAFTNQEHKVDSYTELPIVPKYTV
ncbi:phospholipid-translocating atpase [Fusarium sporotrichioides]|uniref:Phospholipid-translocating atpase n=1 Tax=Fusarium sporotrichioides TaxID=5514 RepID=A0A395S9R1_FUSSP|nr:phospholipid-translocating atpase [Fusarium sporotrichioides]